MQISKINPCYAMNSKQKVKKTLSVNSPIAADKIKFTARFDTRQEQETAEFIFDVLEIVANSNYEKISNPNATPIFFDINLKNTLSGYQSIKNTSSGFIDKIAKSKKYKKFARKLTIGINHDYMEVVLLNFSKTQSGIRRFAENYALIPQLRYTGTTTTADKTATVHIFSSNNGSKKAYIKQTPEGKLLEIISSKYNPTEQREEKSAGFVFNSEGKLYSFEEVQEDNSIRLFTFNDSRIVASERDSNGKLKTKRDFTYQDEKFTMVKEFVA